MIFGVLVNNLQSFIRKMEYIMLSNLRINLTLGLKNLLMFWGQEQQWNLGVFLVLI